MANKKDNHPSKALIVSDVNVRGSVKATDVAGLGAAAKTKSAEIIAKAISGPLGDAVDLTATAIFGRRAAKIRAEGRVLDAQAESQVRLIQVAADEEVKRLRAAGRRLREEELRKQEYIESAAERAIEIANADDRSDVKEIGEELSLNWVDGVKTAHSEKVRDLYSQILANQTRLESKEISGPSLALLKNLDGNLAEAFRKFSAVMFLYGCYPCMGVIQPSGKLRLENREFTLLVEIGFISITTKSEYTFNEFEIGPSQSKFGYVHQEARLTHRAFELALAIYGGKPLDVVFADIYPTMEEAEDFFANIMSVYGASEPHFALELKGENGRKIIKLVIVHKSVGGWDKKIEIERGGRQITQRELHDAIVERKSTSLAVVGAIGKILDDVTSVKMEDL